MLSASKIATFAITLNAKKHNANAIKTYEYKNNAFKMSALANSFNCLLTKRNSISNIISLICYA